MNPDTVTRDLPAAGESLPPASEAQVRNSQGGGQDAGPSERGDVTKIETHRYSLLHYVARRWLTNEATGRLAYLRTIALTVVSTYGVLAIAAFLELPELVARSEALRLPFLRDANVMFMFLVSFPVLTCYLLTDERLLQSALRKVSEDGVVEITPVNASALTAHWKSAFGRANIVAQLIAALIAIAVGVGNFLAYANAGAGYWIAVDGQMTLTGWIYLVVVSLFYFVAIVYVGRTLSVAAFLYDLVARAKLQIFLFHPDNSGGLQPIGRIGLRNQYPLTMFGLNIVILVLVSKFYLGWQPWVAGLIVVAVAAYLLLGPVIFLVPLLPFRRAMLQTRADLMQLVAREARAEVTRLRQALQSKDGFRGYDADAVERIERVGELITHFPVWPFDTVTRRRFFTAYVFPVLGFVFSLWLELR